MLIRRKTIAIRLSSGIIVRTCKNIKFISTEYSKVDEKGGGGVLKVIEKITKDSLEILKIKGSKKVNLLLFMLLNEKDKDDVISAIKGLKKTSPQAFIYKLLKNSKKAWNKLKIKNEILDNRLKILIEDKSKAGVVKKQTEISKTLPSMEFIYEKFSCLYDSMIKAVLSNKTSGKSLPSSQFYPEICVYNDYLLSTHDILSFNSELLDRQFTTINERGIRDFVKRKIENEKNR